MIQYFDPNDIKVRVLVHQFCLENGIVPPDEKGSWVNVGARLKELPADEARVMKRKWRKLWRKLLRRNLKSQAARGHKGRGFNLVFGAQMKVSSKTDNPADTATTQPSPRSNKNNRPPARVVSHRKREVFNWIFDEKIKKVQNAAEKKRAIAAIESSANAEEDSDRTEET
jgi:hypothetical protein